MILQRLCARNARPTWRAAAAALTGLLMVAVSGCGGAAASARSAASAGPSQGSTSAAATHRAPTWSTGAPLPVAVSEVGVAVLGNAVHVLGGYVGGRAHSRTHLAYDVVARRWNPVAPLPVALDHVGAVAVGSGASARLLAIGGYGSVGRPTAAVFAYDPRTNAWTSRAPLPVPRAAGVAVVVAGRVHYLGGKTPSGDTGEHDVYDPVADRWSTAAPMPTARDHAAAAVLGSSIYVAAGRPGGMRVLESYDVRTGRWTTGLPGLPLGRSSVAGVAWQGRFVVLGGENAAETTAYRQVDAYDPTARRWTTLPPMPGARQGIGAVVAGGALLVPGGGPTAGASKQTATLLVLR